jgi:hypothetical protein
MSAPESSDRLERVAKIMARRELTISERAIHSQVSKAQGPAKGRHAILLSRAAEAEDILALPSGVGMGAEEKAARIADICGRRNLSKPEQRTYDQVILSGAGHTEAREAVMQRRALEILVLMTPEPPEPQPELDRIARLRRMASQVGMRLVTSKVGQHTILDALTSSTLAGPRLSTEQAAAYLSRVSLEITNLEEDRS